VGNIYLGLWEEQHYKKNERLNLKETTSQKLQTPIKPPHRRGILRFLQIIFRKNK
jgi:hypothetical protein